MKAYGRRLAGGVLLALLIFISPVAFGDDNHHGDGAPRGDDAPLTDASQALTGGEVTPDPTPEVESPAVATNLEIARKALEDEASKGNIPADAVSTILNSLVPVVEKFVSEAEEDGGPQNERIKVVLSRANKSGTRDLVIEAAPTPGRENAPGRENIQTMVALPSVVVAIPDGAFDNLKASQSFDKLDTLVAGKPKMSPQEKRRGLDNSSGRLLAAFSPIENGGGTDSGIEASSARSRVARGYGLPIASASTARLTPLSESIPEMAAEPPQLVAGAKGFSVLKSSGLAAGARVLAVPELPLDQSLDSPVSGTRFGWRVYVGSLIFLYGVGRLYFAVRSPEFRPNVKNPLDSKVS